MLPSEIATDFMVLKSTCSVTHLDERPIEILRDWIGFIRYTRDSTVHDECVQRSANISEERDNTVICRKGVRQNWGKGEVPKEESPNLMQ